MESIDRPDIPEESFSDQPPYDSAEIDAADITDPNEPSDEHAAAEFDTPDGEIRQLVRQSASELVAVLHPEDIDTPYSLACLASALGAAEGSDAAHAFASDAIASLDLPQENAFGVWAGMYAYGDMDALQKARRAAGLASEDLSFLDAGVMEVGGLYSAERLVILVEAGDEEAVSVARGMSATAYAMERTALLGRLYCSGDEASLGLALKAAQAAQAYADNTGSRHYYRSEAALERMALHAVTQGAMQDAYVLTQALQSDAAIHKIYADMYAAGETHLLPQILEFTARAENVYAAQAVERRLAAAGYQPALEAVRQRLDNPQRLLTGTEDSAASYDLYSYLEDLSVLHNTGDQDAVQKMLEAVRDARGSSFDPALLLTIGQTEVYDQLVRELYAEDPSPYNAELVLETTFDTELWKKVYDYYLRNERPHRAAALTRVLGEQLKP